MKNKFIIFSLIASVIGYSSTLPVNVEIGLSSGYSKLNISEKEFEEVGLKNVSNGGYNSSNINTSLSLNVKYPFKFDKFNVKIGGGIEGFLEANVSKNTFKHLEDNKYGSYLVYEDEINKINDKILDINQKIGLVDYEVGVYANKEAIATSKKEQLTKNIADSNRIISKLEAVIKKYPTEEAVKDLEARFEKASTDGDKFRGEREKVEPKLKEIENQLPTNPKFRELFKEINQYPDSYFEKKMKKANLNQEDIDKYKKLRSEYKIVKKEYDDLSTKIAQASKTKLDLFEDMTLADKAAEKLDKRKKQLADDTIAKDKVSKDETEYKSKKRAANIVKSNLDSIKDELIEEKKSKEEKANEIKNYDLNKHDNEKTAAKVNNILNNNIIFGSNIYGLSEFELKLPKNVTLFVDTKLGLRVSSNPLKAVTDKLEANGDKVDGNTYKRLKNVETVKLSPVIGVGVGLRYKGVTLEISSGLNSALANIKFGYEF
jgi:hypothetical protein